MRQRCKNPRHKNYDRYGGRGIKVCKRWDKFKNFLQDMGPRNAVNYTIERRNNDKGYTPSNCYWANRVDQGRNNTNVKLSAEEVRQIKKLLEFKIPQITLARVYNVSRQTISAIKCGDSWR